MNHYLYAVLDMAKFAAHPHVYTDSSLPLCTFLFVHVSTVLDGDS